MTEKIDFTQDDYLVHAIAKQGLVRCVAIRSTKIVQHAQQIHDLSPASSVALGRFMTGSLLIASDFKNEQNQLTAQIKSDGEIGNMTVIADLQGNVRGEINNPHAISYYHHQGKLNIGKSIGKGSLTVIKDLGLKEPYVGTVELLSGEIAEDIASYYFFSEQIPSIVFLGVKLTPDGVVAAGGMLIQVMPGADDVLLDWLEMRAKGYPDISELVENQISPHQLLDLFFGEGDLEYLETQKVQYFCPCSKERMQKNLMSLGQEDLVSLAEDEEGITLHCHFCETDYHFSRAEIEKLIKKA